MSEDKKDEKSQLLEMPDDIKVEDRDWNEEETNYISNLRKKLTYSRDQREAPHEEFDELTYSSQWLQNERYANTYIVPKANKSEISVQTGTLRKKYKSLVSAIVGTNLEVEYMAYDRNDVAVVAYGQAMGDIKEKTDELDNDDEKKWLRIDELVKQGTIFLQEIWKDEAVTEKKLTKEFDGKFSFNGWTTKLETKDGRPTRDILDGRAVYLGNLKKYFIEDQPYVFTLEEKTWLELEPLFCDFENWKYVSRKKRSFAADAKTTMLTADWTQEDHPDGTCEVIKYQDVPNNEYQIVINGIPMLPIGYPLPWGRRYNIDQQNLDPIRQDFSYGRAFPFDNKNLTLLLDEMIKMMVLKTYKSFAPPYINNTGKVIPSTIFMPGRMTMDIDQTKLYPLDPNSQASGVTAPEFQMYATLRQTIDDKTVSQTFTGGAQQGGTTATQIMETQKQARIMLGTLILAVSLMEKKISISRLLNILQNWFKPLDKMVDEARKELVNRYRIVSKDMNFEKEGQGTRYVIPSKRAMTEDQLRVHEDKMSYQMGKPVRALMIDPDVLEQANLTWYAVVIPKEKKSSDYNKIMFTQKVMDARALGLNLNMDYIQQQFAEVHGDDPAKLFSQGTPPPIAGAMGADGGVVSKILPSKIKPPVMQVPTPDNGAM